MVASDKAKKSDVAEIVPKKNALRKKDVVSLRAEQRSLVDLQDQKIDVLCVKVAHLNDCFQIARQKRIELQELYETRRKEVRASIEKTKNDITEIFAQKHRIIKDFAAEWMATLHDAIKEWEETLADRSVEMEDRLQDVRNEITRFHSGLAVEREQRYKAIEEAASGLHTHLDSIRVDLKATRDERLVAENRYAEKFSKHFERLHKLVEDETEIRKEEWEVSVRDLKEAYKRIHEKEDVIERDVTHFLESEQVNLDVEEAHREVCQSDILHGSIKFLDYLKDNIAEDVDNSKKRNDQRRGYIELPMVNPLQE